MDDLDRAGETMLGWARELYPIRRSLTGEGVRETLDFLEKRLPGLRRRSVPSGSEAFDWTVPKEWRFRSARLVHESGKVVVDAEDNFLHVLGYSTGIDTTLSRADLDAHLYSMPDQPDLIPYVTSYYRERWGFCLSHTQRQTLPEGLYHARIDAELVDGQLDYADLVIPGETDREIMFSTYICHPNLANNELSGPVLATRLAQEIASWKTRRYTYRFVFVPETIGALVYLSSEIDALKDRVEAGFVLSCVGDERGYSHVQSPSGDTLADRALSAVLKDRPNAVTYDYTERGSDERQYCAPGVDLPVCGFCRTKYGIYPEYHTSADDFTVVTARGLADAFGTMREMVTALELNGHYRAQIIGEPQLGKRGLYPTISIKGAGDATRLRLNVLGFSDGSRDIFDLARRIKAPVSAVCDEITTLSNAGLLRPLPQG